MVRTTTTRTTRVARASGATATIAVAALLAGCTGGEATDTQEGTTASPTATASASPSAGTSAATPEDSLPADVTAALDAVLDAGAVAVQVEVRDGDTVVGDARGTADVGDGRPADPDDPVRIASISKTVLAVVVLQLVQEGALDLETTVEEVLPGLLTTAPADVTVAQLLAHTSGLPDYIATLAPDVGAATGGSAGLGAPRSPEELVALAQEQPWLDEPGSAFHYSNAGYTVLGLMTEAVTGRSVADLMTTRVLDPLGMDATTYPTDSAVPDTALRGYLTIDGGPVDATATEPWFWSFGASLISNVGDVGTFVAALNGGDLLEAETLQAMREVGVEGYGLGVLAAGDACGAQPPELVFGQRGNGFGYNAITLGSADGERVVTIAWTGGTFDPAADPIFPAVNGLLVAGLAATCP